MPHALDRECGNSYPRRWVEVSHNKVLLCSQETRDSGETVNACIFFSKDTRELTAGNIKSIHTWIFESKIEI